MTTIRNYTDIYHKEFSRYKTQIKNEEHVIEKNNKVIDRATRSNERAHQRIRKLKMPRWTDFIIEEIAKEMLLYFPDEYSYEIRGPYGLGSRVVIDIKANLKDLPEYSFTFTPNLSENSDSNLMWIDRSMHTNRFAPGTIGEINGFNYPNIPIPNETTIKDLILIFYPEFKFKKHEKDNNLSS
jgi:hypothetical protein